MTAGHEETFAAALTAQIPALRRYATALLGHATAADDLVQDCVERALRQADSLLDPLRMGAWLRSILHNLHIDAVRRNRRQGVKVDLAEVDNTLAAVVPPRDHATVIDMGRAMAALSVEHRQILLLIGLEGLNYREAAAELDVPIGTIMSRLARARERLRQELGSSGRAGGTS